MPFDRARFMEALAEFDAELCRIRAAETHDLGDLVDVISEVVDPEDTGSVRPAIACVRSGRMASGICVEPSVAFASGFLLVREA